MTTTRPVRIPHPIAAASPWRAHRRLVEQYLRQVGVAPETVVAAIDKGLGDVWAVDTRHSVWRRLVVDEPAAQADPERRWREAHRVSYREDYTPAMGSAALAALVAGFPDRARQLAAYAIDTATREAFERDLLACRNDVNRRLGRRQMDADQARQANAVTPPADAPPAVWVAGYPGLVGGAGPELWHMLRLWRRHGVDVHLVPINDQPDAAMRRACDRLGCWTHKYRPDVFAGRVVASWCNHHFLKALPEIHAAGRPRLVLWANCMTWTFGDELACHRDGLIDLHLFQSDHQRGHLLPGLEALRPVRELTGFRPHFDADDDLQAIRFQYRDPAEAGYFAVGRISRADPSKFAPDCWQTFAAVRAPLPVKTFVLGHSDQVREKIGPVPAGLDYLLWPSGGVPVAHALARLHVLVHQVDNSRENWPRVVLEAMAAGVPVVAQRAFGTAEMIEDGVTGFLCDSGPEMAARATLLAHDEPRRRAMIDAARERLDALAGDAAAWAAWSDLWPT